MVPPGSRAASRRADRNWAPASSRVSSGPPARSVRPTPPGRSEPPVHTAAWPSGAVTAKARWLSVCPGVAMTVTVSDPAASSSVSVTLSWRGQTWCAALTA